MANPAHLVEAIGDVDGVNRDFSASEPYEPGTLRALRNGRLLSRDFEDGYDELDPSLGTFRLRVAPRVGDVIFCFYVEAV
jgi:hypothetical protein